jgi:hypothetical protein
MRINRSRMINQWIHCKNEDYRLKLEILGTEEELQKLMHLISIECGKTQI